MSLEPNVSRIVARLARQVELGLAGVDLSLAQYRLLMLLEERPAVASKLADKLAVSRPSITAVVDGLVSRGLVERRTSCDDRRRVEHDLTAAGRCLLHEADERLNRRLGDIAGHLSDGDAAIQALSRWAEALDAHRSALLGAQA